ncbi:AsnC family protein [Nocardiopsis gilva]|uniref:AsnC family protein n=1 Tax=Nocardiopsis gilva TaxID=280236 RepID=UPI00373AEB23
MRPFAASRLRSSLAAISAVTFGCDDSVFRVISNFVPQSSPSLKDACTLDDLDRALVHVLHIDGRASFSQIAASPDFCAR